MMKIYMAAIMSWYLVVYVPILMASIQAVNNERLFLATTQFEDTFTTEIALKKSYSPIQKVFIHSLTSSKLDLYSP